VEKEEVRSIDLPPHAEGVTGSEVSLSPDGKLGVIRIGSGTHRIILYDLQVGSVLFDTTLEAAPSGRPVRAVKADFEVDNDGNVKAEAVLKTTTMHPQEGLLIALFDREGKLLQMEKYDSDYLEGVFDNS